MAGPHSTPEAPKERRTQDVLNESWPQSDDRAPAHARDISDQPIPVPIWVRVEWAVDGEEWVEAMATRWTRTHAFCSWIEPRLPINGLWVRIQDTASNDYRSGPPTS